MGRGYGGPGRYIQRRGEIRRIAAHAAQLGDSAFCLIDSRLFGRFGDTIAASFKSNEGGKIRLEFGSFNGECSRAEIERVTRSARQVQAGVIIGVGGGKTIDTAKVVAHALDARLLVVPTTASSDAPCSAIAVVYSDDGVFEESRHLPRNPDVVLVDPEVIVTAPARLFIAGIGDALSTWFEARSNQESRSNNYVGSGYSATLAGIAIAEKCHAILMRDALKAKLAVEAGACTAAVENIIEANTLLSGLGFENCGCSAAHGIHDALTQLPETHAFLHGEKVAFGTLCLLMLENRDADEIAAMVRFCRAIGLPTTLADLHIVEDVRIKVERVAQGALKRPDNIIHATPVELSVPLVRDAILALDAIARALPTHGF